MTTATLPRLTATCYAEQVEIHRALNLNLVPPGGAVGRLRRAWVV